MKKVVVYIPVEPENRERIQAIAKDYEFTYLLPPETDILSSAKPDFKAFSKELAEAEISFGVQPINLIKKMPKLSWVHLSMSGADAYCVPGVLPETTALTCSTGAFGQAISEHMLACTLALYKKLPLYRDNMADGLWKGRGAVKSPEGATVLVIGLGDIGGRYAKLMKLLGAHTIGVRRSGFALPDYIDELYHNESIDMLLPRADIVAMALPNTPSTAGMIDKRRLALMMPGAVILNVGRGNAIDTEALCDALESGQLGGCALDVTDPEPLPKSHRLWKIPTALVTPHISGFFHLRKTYDNIIDIFCAELERYVSGRPLENTVDRKSGYRKTI